MDSRLAVDLVAFDLGGTTVRDEGAVPYALQRALEPLGIRPNDDDVSAVRGMNKRSAIATLIHRVTTDNRGADSAIDLAYERFVAALHAAYLEGPVEAAEGAEALFNWLHERDAKVAITTGFDRSTRELILRRLGWDDGRLDAVVGGDDVTAGRPAPYMLFRAMELTGARSVRRIAAIGDTVADLEAGTNAGASFVVGVLGGAHGLDLLGPARHTHIIHSLYALPPILTT
jgi:phosphonatase-like hydrolase